MSAIKPLTTIRVPNPVSADDIAQARAELCECRATLREHAIEKERERLRGDEYCEQDLEVYRKRLEAKNAFLDTFHDGSIDGGSYRQTVKNAFFRNHAEKLTPELKAFAIRAAKVVSSTVPFHVFMTNSALMDVEEQCALVAEKYPEEFTTTRPVLNLTVDDWIARVLAPNDRTWYETLAEKANVVVLAHQETASDKNPQ
jgi:hypothetical protein